jgi:hypothetical protein
MGVEPVQAVLFDENMEKLTQEYKGERTPSVAGAADPEVRRQEIAVVQSNSSLDDGLDSVYLSDVLSSISNSVMRARFQTAWAMVDDARQELTELRQQVAAGDAAKELVHGRWLTSISRGTEMKIIEWHSQTGGVISYEKRVYGDLGLQNEMNNRGWELGFDIDGHLKHARRRDDQEIIEFFPNGKVQEFGVSKYEGERYVGAYIATWNSEGKLLSELNPVNFSTHQE